jgi:hypothetical protein
MCLCSPCCISCPFPFMSISCENFVMFFYGQLPIRADVPMNTFRRYLYFQQTIFSAHYPENSCQRITFDDIFSVTDPQGITFSASFDPINGQNQGSYFFNLTCPALGNTSQKTCSVYQSVFTTYTILYFSYSLDPRVYGRRVDPHGEYVRK